MKIEKSNVSDVFRVLKTIMPPKASGLLEAVLVKDSYFIADNFDYTVGTRAPAEDAEPFVLPKKAIEMIESLSGVIEIEPEEKTLRISCNGVKSHFSTVPAATFIISNSFDHSKCRAFEFDADTLCAKFCSVLYACAPNDKGKVTGGVRLLGDGSTLEFSALDGYRLALDGMDYTEELDIMIPFGVIRQVLAMKPVGRVFVYVGANKIIFETDTYMISSKLITAQPLDYTALFPKGDENQFVCNRVEMLEALSRCLICANSDQRKEPVLLECEDETIYVSTKTQTSNYEESLPVYGAGAMKIAVDGRYLVDALKSFGEDKVTIHYVASTKPLVITGETGTAVVLPVKVKA